MQYSHFKLQTVPFCGIPTVGVPDCMDEGNLSMVELIEKKLSPNIRGGFLELLRRHPKSSLTKCRWLCPNRIILCADSTMSILLQDFGKWSANRLDDETKRTVFRNLLGTTIKAVLFWTFLHPTIIAP